MWTRRKSIEFWIKKWGFENAIQNHKKIIKLWWWLFLSKCSLQISLYFIKGNTKLSAVLLPYYLYNLFHTQTRQSDYGKLIYKVTMTASKSKYSMRDNGSEERFTSSRTQPGNSYGLHTWSYVKHAACGATDTWKACSQWTYSDKLDVCLSVHRCICVEKKSQIVVTICFIALMIRSTCFGHLCAHHQQL